MTLKFLFALISFILNNIYVEHYHLHISACLRTTVSLAWNRNVLGFNSRMQNSALGNYRDAAAHGKLWNPKNNWELCSPSSRLLRPICIVRSGWLAAIDRQGDPHCPLISKWQRGDNSQVTDLPLRKKRRREIPVIVIAVELLLGWTDTYVILFWKRCKTSLYLTAHNSKERYF